jgi:hypothetical protein
MAICVGCDRDSDDMVVDYGKDNPVRKDRTYANSKFVCNSCLIKLRLMGLDIGTPLQIQDNMLIFMGKKKDK